MTARTIAALTLALGLAGLACSGSPEAADDYVDKMAKEHKDDTPVAAAAGDAALGDVEGVTSEKVVYGSIDGKPITGFYAKPDGGADDLPALIVIHEWWGLNENIEMMTKRLAKEGYQALAVDMYGGGVADNPDDAMAMMKKAMEVPELGDKNIEQAHKFLADKGATKFGSIGWCFGGAWSLRAAIGLKGELDAAVIYYGRLETDKERLGRIEAPVMGLFGEADKGIPVESVRAWMTAMGELGKPVKSKIYPGADHAFANPSGQHYNEEAARDAWGKTLEFFAQHLKAADSSAGGADAPADDS